MIHNSASHSKQFIGRNTLQSYRQTFQKLLAAERFPPNLTQWNDNSHGVFAYLRDSVAQPGRKPRDSSWQLTAVQQMLSHLTIHNVFYDHHSSGYCIGPQLREGIRLARETGIPLLALEYRRFTRTPQLLEAYPDVQFLALLPLSQDEHKLNALCKKIRNCILPEGKGGRPPRIENSVSILTTH